MATAPTVPPTWAQHLLADIQSASSEPTQSKELQQPPEKRHHKQEHEHEHEHQQPKNTSEESTMALQGKKQFSGFPATLIAGALSRYQSAKGEIPHGNISPSYNSESGDILSAIYDNWPAFASSGYVWENLFLPFNSVFRGLLGADFCHANVVLLAPCDVVKVQRKMHYAWVTPLELPAVMIDSSADTSTGGAISTASSVSNVDVGRVVGSSGVAPFDTDHVSGGGLNTSHGAHSSTTTATAALADVGVDTGAGSRANANADAVSLETPIRWLCISSETTDFDTPVQLALSEVQRLALTRHIEVVSRKLQRLPARALAPASRFLLENLRYANLELHDLTLNLFKGLVMRESDSHSPDEVHLPFLSALIREYCRGGHRVGAPCVPLRNHDSRLRQMLIQIGGQRTAAFCSALASYVALVNASTESEAAKAATATTATLCATDILTQVASHQPPRFFVFADSICLDAMLARILRFASLTCTVAAGIAAAATNPATPADLHFDSTPTGGSAVDSGEAATCAAILTTLSQLAPAASVKIPTVLPRIIDVTLATAATLHSVLHPSASAAVAAAAMTERAATAMVTYADVHSSAPAGRLVMGMCADAATTARAAAALARVAEPPSAIAGVRDELCRISEMIEEAIAPPNASKTDKSLSVPGGRGNNEKIVQGKVLRQRVLLLQQQQWRLDAATALLVTAQREAQRRSTDGEPVAPKFGVGSSDIPVLRQRAADLRHRLANALVGAQSELDTIAHMRDYRSSVSPGTSACSLTSDAASGASSNASTPTNEIEQHFRHGHDGFESPRGLHGHDSEDDDSTASSDVSGSIHSEMRQSSSIPSVATTIPARSTSSQSMDNRPARPNTRHGGAMITRKRSTDGRRSLLSEQMEVEILAARAAVARLVRILFGLLPLHTFEQLKLHSRRFLRFQIDARSSHEENSSEEEQSWSDYVDPTAVSEACWRALKPLFRQLDLYPLLAVSSRAKKTSICRDPEFAVARWRGADVSAATVVTDIDRQFRLHQSWRDGCSETLLLSRAAGFNGDIIHPHAFDFNDHARKRSSSASRTTQVTKPPPQSLALQGRIDRSFLNTAGMEIFEHSELANEVFIREQYAEQHLRLHRLLRGQDASRNQLLALQAKSRDQASIITELKATAAKQQAALSESQVETSTIVNRLQHDVRQSQRQASAAEEEVARLREMLSVAEARSSSQEAAVRKQSAALFALQARVDYLTSVENSPGRSCCDSSSRVADLEERFEAEQSRADVLASENAQLATAAAMTSEHERRLADLAARLDDAMSANSRLREEMNFSAATQAATAAQVAAADAAAAHAEKVLLQAGVRHAEHLAASEARYTRARALNVALERRLIERAMSNGGAVLEPVQKQSGDHATGLVP